VPVARIIRTIVMPAAIFQGVGIGGGYGSGRELVEYFTKYGAMGGIQAIVLATVVLAIVLALSFELCRWFGAYDYRKFFRALIGRYWILFEVVYFVIFLIVLAVIASASGTILNGQFGMAPWAGTILFMAITATLIFCGREWVLRTVTAWTIVLNLSFIAYFFFAFREFGPNILAALQEGEVRAGWWVSGFNYALICTVVVPAVFFAARDFETRTEALVSGCVSATLFMLPALLFHFVFTSLMPDVSSIPVPTYWSIALMQMPLLLSLYTVAIFGAFVQTGAGFIQGLNERLDGWWSETHQTSLPRSSHLVVAVVSLIVSTALSQVGIITLIARGYTTMAWFLLFVFVIPVVARGWRVVLGPRDALPGASRGDA